MKYNHLGTMFDRLQEGKEVITATGENLNPGGERWIRRSHFVSDILY